MIRLRFDDTVEHSCNKGFEMVERFRKLKRSGKKEVDENRETLHNLASLLLTNTTLRRMQQGSLNCLFFNNKQSISVGV